MSHETACLVIALAAEDAELRQQLAEAQDQCVELAMDAGELYAQIPALQDELARVRDYRDVARCALDLEQFGHLAPGATREEVGDRPPLRLQAKPGSALPLGRDPQV